MAASLWKFRHAKRVGEKRSVRGGQPDEVYSKRIGAAGGRGKGAENRKSDGGLGVFLAAFGDCPAECCPEP